MFTLAPKRSEGRDQARGLLIAVLVGCGFLIAARLSLYLPRQEGRLAPIWFADAVVLTALLRTDLRRWPAIIAACLTANFALSVSISNVPIALSMTLANGVEYGLAASLLRLGVGRTVRMERGGHLLALVAAGLLAAMAAGLVAGVGLSWAAGDALVSDFTHWWIGHGLSLVLLTPSLLVLADAREHLRERPLTPRGALAGLALAVCVVVVFTQSTGPLLFIIPPVLLVVAVELGAFGAACGLILTALVSVTATFAHLGPISLTRGSALEQAAVLQLFLVVCTLSSLPVAAMQTRQRRLQASTLAEADRASRAEIAASVSEARYRLLAEHVRDAIVQIDLQGEIVFISPSILAIIGHTDSELTGQLTQTFIHPDDYPQVTAAYGDLAEGRRAPGQAIEYRCRRKDGSWIWLQVNPQVLCDPDGRPTGFVDVARDITDRKALEAELRTARAQAEAAAEVKSQFLANMSHELRTPLTAVLGFADLIGGQPELSTETRRYLERVRSGGRALLATVNDVLDFSKLEAGQVEICASPTDPAELTAEVLELFQAQAKAKGLRLRLEVSKGSPSRIDFDPDRVRQVLTNLIGNAVKFTEAGEVSVSLSYAEGRLHATVSDTGHGIAPERTSLLFQRFSQVDGSNTRRHGGTGLGLAICKGLVEAMGGVIGVRSRVGAGSDFFFTLPAPETREAPPTAARDDLPAAPQFAGRYRLLLAEDNMVNRELVKALLAPFPIDIDMAGTGVEAVEAARLCAYDLVMMDLHMPDMGGLEAATAIRSERGVNAATPILAFSADVLAPEADVFDGLISKPITPRDLFAALEDHLGRERAAPAAFEDRCMAV